MTNRGNGYFEAEYGCRDAALIEAGYSMMDCDHMIARTDGDVIYAYSDCYSKRNAEEINKWADEYGYQVEWV